MLSSKSMATIATVRIQSSAKSPKVKKWFFEEILDPTVRRDSDRELFDLPPKEGSE